MRDGEEGREHPGLVRRGGVNHSCWTSLLVLTSDAVYSSLAALVRCTRVSIGQMSVNTECPKPGTDAGL